MALSSPPKLGRYDIVEEIGKGAMGVVYLARDPLIGRLVALKTFRVGFSVGDDELHQFRARFIREAQSAGILSHPNIVTVHDVQDGAADGFTFIAMEYVPGVDLKELLQRDETLELDFVVSIISQVADALDYAHSKGVIHRDVKPANVIIDLSKKVKITDFGIARLESSNLTQDGQLLGTPNYMAPEQILGKELDHRVDVFSLGVMLYELLTRRKPFQGDNLTIVSHRIAFEDFTPAHQFVAAITPEIEQVLSLALQKDPDRRYGSAGELAAGLRRAVSEGRAGPEAPAVTVMAPVPAAQLARSAAPPPTPAFEVPALPVDLPALPIFDSPTPPGESSSSPPAATTPDAMAGEPVPDRSTPPSPIALPPPSVLSGADFLRRDVDRGQVARVSVAPGAQAAPGETPGEAPPAVSWLASETGSGERPTNRSGSVPTPAVHAASAPKKRAASRAGGLFRALGVGLVGGVILAAVLLALRPDTAAIGRPSAEHEMLTRLLPLIQRSAALEVQGDLPGAILAGKEAERVAPERASLQRRRERLELAAGSQLQAAEAAAAVADLVRLGEELLVKRRYEDAATQARNALALAADDPAALDLLARAQAELVSARDRRNQRLASASPAPTSAALAPAPAPLVEAPPATGDATLEIDFLTEVSEGALTIYVNKKQVLLEPFRFVRRTGILRSEPSAGRIQDRRTLVPGEATIQIYVTPSGKPARAKTLQGNFLPGAKRMLTIRLNSAGEVSAELE